MGFFEWIDGKKTYIGGGCVILGAIAKVGADWYYGNFIDWDIAIKTIGAGMAIIGVGHKIEKAI